MASAITTCASVDGKAVVGAGLSCTCGTAKCDKGSFCVSATNECAVGDADTTLC